MFALVRAILLSLSCNKRNLELIALAIVILKLEKTLPILRRKALYILKRNIAL